MLNVTTADIKGKKDDKDLTKKDLERMFPANRVTKSNILITRLRTNEQLHFKANLVLHTARDNAAFSPVSLCNFFYLQDPVVAKKKDNILDKERSYYTNKYGDANAVQFEIEPINNLIGPKYLVNKAFEIIIDKLNNLISTIASEGFVLQPFQDLKSTFDFVIQNEDDTLGNIIMSYIHNKYVREDKAALDNMHCSYVGYICPHPLKAELILRITLDDQINPVTFIRFLEANCRMIIDELTNIKKEWNVFA
jgi:DNA-directed RNA polymerase subunit L